MLRTVLHEISPSSLLALSWYSPASWGCTLLMSRTTMPLSYRMSCRPDGWICRPAVVQVNRGGGFASRRASSLHATFTRLHLLAQKATTHAKVRVVHLYTCRNWLKLLRDLLKADKLVKLKKSKFVSFRLHNCFGNLNIASGLSQAADMLSLTSSSAIAERPRCRVG